MVDVKEKVADRCGGLGEGEGERPFLQGISLIITLHISQFYAILQQNITINLPN